MRRREFIAGLSGAAAISAWPLTARAQQRAPKIYRIGLVTLSKEQMAPELLNAFRAGLRERGYIEGQNITIEYRFANGRIEQYPAAVAELIRLNADVIVAWTSPAVAAAKQATSTIPIVMVGVADPVGLGLVADLARPGGNVTGLSNLARDISSKLIGLLVDIVPAIKRVAILNNPSNFGVAAQRPGTEAAARSKNLDLIIVDASVPADLGSAFARISGAASQGIVVLADPMFVSERKQIAELALTARLPTVFQRRENVEAGGLVSFGSSLRDQLYYLAVYVDKILKGAKPADLPVEQPTKFELVINQKTAKALGLTMPPTLLGTADEVIE